MASAAGLRLKILKSAADSRVWRKRVMARLVGKGASEVMSSTEPHCLASFLGTARFLCALMLSSSAGLA